MIIPFPENLKISTFLSVCLSSNDATNTFNCVVVLFLFLRLLLPFLMLVRCLLAFGVAPKQARLDGLWRVGAFLVMHRALPTQTRLLLLAWGRWNKRSRVPEETFYVPTGNGSASRSPRRRHLCNPSFCSRWAGFVRACVCVYDLLCLS